MNEQQPDKWADLRGDQWTPEQIERMKNSPAVEQKLVEFFRSPEGEQLGRDGDHDNLTPVETAIRAMRKLLQCQRATAAATLLACEQLRAALKQAAPSGDST